MIRFTGRLKGWGGRALVLAVALGLSIESPGQEKAPTAKPESVTLTPQVVVDRVLSLGLERQALDAQLQAAELPLFQARAPLDFRLMAETNYEVNRGDTMNVISNNEEDKNFKALLGVSKKFLSGTDVRLNYQRTSISSLLNPFAQSQNFPSTRTLDVFSLEVEQDLLSNAFGRVDRLRQAQAQRSLQRAGEERLESLESLILESMERFWHSFVAQENLKESLESRDRYEKLVATVRNKARLGFSAPGELATAQAEYESQVQRVKVASLNYLEHLDQLLRLLRLDLDVEVSFQIEELLPPLPELAELEPEEQEALRSVQVARSQLEEGRLALDITRSQHRPQLSLITRISQTGAEEEPSQALSKAFEGQRPIYFVGLQFSHPLDSSQRRGELAAARAQHTLNELQLETARDQILLQLRQSQRQVQSLRQVAESASQAVELWQRALRELEASYRQGRTDISEVVRVYNSLLAAQTQRSRAIGDYHIALNSLAAARDQLVNP